MILTGILNVLFLFFDFLISIFPSVEFIQPAINNIDLLAIGFVFFPGDVLLLIMASVILWQNVHLAWAVVEWVYKKIPGVN